MSKLKEQIERRIRECIVSGDKIESGLLKTVLGEIQTLEMRNNKISDEDVEKVLRKFKQGAEETLGFLKTMDIPPDGNDKMILDEIKIYEQFIPETMSSFEIAKKLSQVTEILEAKSTGQAIGIAMKFCKTNGLNVLGQDVKDVVESLRT